MHIYLNLKELQVYVYFSERHACHSSLSSVVFQTSLKYVFFIMESLSASRESSFKLGHDCSIDNT